MELFNPIKLHTAAMNQVDQANRSNDFILFKMVKQSRANAIAVATGTYAAIFFAGKTGVSFAGAIIKTDLTIVRFITFDKRQNLGYHKLPGFSDCYAAALRTLKLYLGIFTSISGVFVIGSRYNAAEQRKLGNCKKYESEIRGERKSIFMEAADKCGKPGMFPHSQAIDWDLAHPQFNLLLRTSKIKVKDAPEIGGDKAADQNFNRYVNQLNDIYHSALMNLKSKYRELSSNKGGRVLQEVLSEMRNDIEALQPPKNKKPEDINIDGSGATGVGLGDI